MSDTIYLNLDHVEEKPKAVIRVEGVEHPLKPLSVKDFMANLRDIESLNKPGASMALEVAVMMNMIHRGFPTIKIEDLEEWTMLDLQKIALVARGGAVGEDATAEEVAEGNVPAAI